MKQILRKILWEGKSKWLMAGAVLGAFLGFWLLLSAVQFYCDFQRMMSGDANPGDQFEQVNKKVNLFNTLGAKSTFSEEEIEGLKKEPFVQELGQFTANGFRVGAFSEMLNFYTELFFEAVPDEFLDVNESKFRWSEGQQEIPILLSKDYLALYNFGFAPSQGLPQFTPSTIQKLQMDVRISGKGRQVTFKGRIVGFSERINSVLVPQSFMDWANGEFGNGSSGNTSRLILKVDNPMSKEFRNFLNEKGYEVSTGRLIGGQFGVLLRIILGIVAALGGIILLLSVLVFVLNFQLLIAQSAPDIRLLLELGHTPASLAGVLNRRMGILFGIVALVVFGTLLGTRQFIVQYFDKQGFTLSGNLDILVWGIGFALTAVLIFTNYWNINRSVRRQSN